MDKIRVIYCLVFICVIVFVLLQYVSLNFFFNPCHYFF